MRNDNNQLPLNFLSVLRISLSLCVLTADLSSRVCAMQLNICLDSVTYVDVSTVCCVNECIKRCSSLKNEKSVIIFSHLHCPTPMQLTDFCSGEILYNVHAAFFFKTNCRCSKNGTKRTAYITYFPQMKESHTSFGRHESK